MESVDTKREQLALPPTEQRYFQQKWDSESIESQLRLELLIGLTQNQNEQIGRTWT